MTTFKTLAPPPPTNQGVDSRQFRDWFYQVFNSNSNFNLLGTMSTQNSDSVSITGGSIDGVNIGEISPVTIYTNHLRTTALTGYLYGNGSSGNVTASTTIPYGNITGLGTIVTQNLGASGTFKSGDATPKTITVVNGIITSIV